MDYSTWRRSKKSRHSSHESSRGGGAVIAPALSLDIIPLKRQQSKISVPPRSSSLNRTSRRESFPALLKAEPRRRPPVLPTLEPPLYHSRSADCLPAVDPGRLSPLRSCDSGSYTAAQIGIQMLVNTLGEDTDEDSDEEEDGENEENEEEEEPEIGEDSGQGMSSRVSALGSRLSRLEIPLPAVNRSSEADSECSSIFDNPERRNSSASTIPTPTSECSIRISGGRRSVLSPKRDQSATETNGPATDSHAPTESKPHAPAGRSSTFFCRGNRSSFVSNNSRFSIGLGSIAESEIDLNAGLDDSTHFPGMDELKKQISWLSLRSPGIYGADGGGSDDGDEDDEGDEGDEGNGGDDGNDGNDGEDYHSHLASMVPRKGSFSAAPAGPANPAAKLHIVPQQPLVGPVLQAPSRRGNRRRTASSECVVLETLEQMRLEGRRSSIELCAQRGRAMAMGQDFWDNSIFEDTTVWDQMLYSN